uniref:High-affinity choline transporter 1-like n=1 Tax=Knipowitschia caucasica TaxID=637954 RepID=A0AAV2MKL9_KNICA
MNVPGLVTVLLFYLLVLGIGIWASVKSKRNQSHTEPCTEHTLLGNRGISLTVGVFTMTATFVGGGFITGLTEAVYTPTMGLTWAVMPVTAAISFIIGGLFFAKKMRERKYVTMMDPFQQKYGNMISAILSVALLISDIIWVTGTLIGLGYQDFHQRTLSSSSASTARTTCFIAAPMMFVLGIPPVLIGAAAASTNWSMTTYGSPSPYERGEAGQVLPIALHHLSPSFISIVGIGAVAAAVMSSTDSALLSAASIFTSNIYKNILRTKAAETELQWVIRITVVVVGLLGTSLSFLSNSVMMFWILGSSITYTIMFPQLVCVLFCDVSNACGCVMGILTAALIKVLSGEPALGWPPLFYYPGCPVVDGAFRTWRLGELLTAWMEWMLPPDRPLLEKNLRQAIKHYHSALLILRGLDSDVMSPLKGFGPVAQPLLPEQEMLLRNTQVDIFNNLAACLLQKETVNYSRVQEYSLRVLHWQPHNVKALYRAGVATLELGDPLMATVYLTQAFKEQPHDVNIKKYLQKSTKKQNQELEREKAMYREMFSPTTKSRSGDGLDQKHEIGDEGLHVL